MEFGGRYTIPGNPEAVWDALNDPTVLKACIPGCETLTKVGPTNFIGAMRLKIGPLSATFRGSVTLAELDRPRRCILKGEGQGGVAGFARGQSEILLHPDGSGTALIYKANANVGGKLAQVGQRLVDGAAKQIADEFFFRFSAIVGAAGGPAQDESAPIAPPTQKQAEPERASREGLSPEIWVIGLIAIVAILLVLFGFVLR